MKRILVFLLLLISLISEGQVSRNYTIDKTIEGSRAYRKRVTADAGVIRSDGLEKAYRAQAIANALNPNIVFSWCGETGYKVRTSGIYNYYTKLYSTVGTNDAAQSTDLNQPFRSGEIAPNERYCLKNPNGAARYMTHTAASFLSTNPWSIEVVLNWNGSNLSNAILCGSSGSAGIYIKISDANKIFFSNGTTTAIGTSSINKVIGKNTVFTFVASGSNTLAIYINGAFVESLSVATNIDFTRIFSNGLASRDTYGKIYSYTIFNTALTASQCLSRYNFLRTIYPDISSVQIGSQYWATSNYEAVCTPQGNLINEVQNATNTEKVTATADRDFSSDTGWWSKFGTASISGGIVTFIDGSNTYSGIRKTSLLTVDKYYKVSFDVINYVSGGIQVIAGSTVSSSISSNGSKVIYIKCTSSSTFEIAREFAGGAFSFSIDNISVQEVGWSDSQNLYDWVYANTSGTTEQKTYAAVKAAGMWCHYNNDPILGAVYGKLYNWYAVKLLQMDIDYYNTANPTAKWGWHIPSQTEFTTLQTTLGGSTVAGGKMKATGTSYWSNPNTGADNSSGFSALPGGYRGGNGSFTINGSYGILNSIDNQILIRTNDATLTTTSVTKTEGLSLRLIKD